MYDHALSFLSLSPGTRERPRALSYLVQIAISWNIFIIFEVIVNETLFLPLVYLLSRIRVF